MSKIILILSTFILFACRNSPIHTSDDRLYQHVDSLITQVLHYEYNEDSFIRPYVRDTIIKRPANGLQPSHSTMPLNPEPRILFDGVIIKKEDLLNYNMDNIQAIELMEADIKASALFGTMGKNGAIIITTTKFKKQK
ncbi:MAG: hypothetical protein RIC35_06165 [Marinoscillum sp.]